MYYYRNRVELLLMGFIMQNRISMSLLDLQNRKCLLFFEGNIKQQNIVYFISGDDKDYYDIRYITN